MAEHDKCGRLLFIALFPKRKEPGYPPSIPVPLPPRRRKKRSCLCQTLPRLTRFMMIPRGSEYPRREDSRTGLGAVHVSIRKSQQAAHAQNSLLAPPDTHHPSGNLTFVLITPFYVCKYSQSDIGNSSVILPISGIPGLGSVSLRRRWIAFLIPCIGRITHFCIWSQHSYAFSYSSYRCIIKQRVSMCLFSLPRNKQGSRSSGNDCPSRS